MPTRNDPQDEFTGQRLPGTGGDVIRRDDDVEGHRAIRGEEEAIRRDDDGAIRRDDDGAIRRDDDVEGHRLIRELGQEELYRGGPTTQGEVIRRGPGDNPHGER